MQEHTLVDLCLAIARTYETDEREILREAQELLRILSERKDHRRREGVY